jgi:hypothetical protein
MQKVIEEQLVPTCSTITAWLNHVSAISKYGLIGRIELTACRGTETCADAARSVQKEQVEPDGVFAL